MLSWECATHVLLAEVCTWNEASFHEMKRRSCQHADQGRIPKRKLDEFLVILVRYVYQLPLKGAQYHLPRFMTRCTLYKLLTIADRRIFVRVERFVSRTYIGLTQRKE